MGVKQTCSASQPPTGQLIGRRSPEPVGAASPAHAPTGGLIIAPMGQTSARPKVHGKFFVPPLLERRLSAALVDMTLVLGCCTALSHSFTFFATTPHPLIWIPAALLLAALALAESITGSTPGKMFARLTLLRRDGSRPPLYIFVLRCAIKFLPVGVYLLALWLGADPMVFIIVAAIAFTLAFAELQACYLAIMRTGYTIFDLSSGTVAVRSGRDHATTTAGGPDTTFLPSNNNRDAEPPSTP